jgi:hypothetical protein
MKLLSQHSCFILIFRRPGKSWHYLDSERCFIIRAAVFHWNDLRKEAIVRSRNYRLKYDKFVEVANRPDNMKHLAMCNKNGGCKIKWNNQIRVHTTEVRQLIVLFKGL